MKLKMKNTEFGDFAEDLEKFLNAKTIDEAVSILSDRIKKRFNKFFILDENITIYRCRIINDLNEIKTIQNITYPDPKKIELGHARLNQKDEALFYGASHNMTSFTETVPDVFFHENVPVLACISEWTNQTKIPTFQLGIVGMDRLRVTKTGQPLPDNHEQLIFEELVHQLFKFPDVDYYLQTTALRKYLQLEADKLKNPWTADDVGFVYPTVKTPLLYNAPYNLAVPPAVADTKLVLKDIKIWEMERPLAGDTDSVVMKPVKELSEIVGGEITWKN